MYSNVCCSIPAERFCQTQVAAYYIWEARVKAQKPGSANEDWRQAEEWLRDRRPHLFDPIVQPPCLRTIQQLAHEKYLRRVALRLPGTPEGDWTAAQRERNHLLASLSAPAQHPMSTRLM